MKWPLFSQDDRSRQLRTLPRANGGRTDRVLWKPEESLQSRSSIVTTTSYSALRLLIDLNNSRDSDLVTSRLDGSSFKDKTENYCAIVTSPPPTKEAGRLVVATQSQPLTLNLLRKG